MEHKKGFTLIEVLTVIVILGIILIIAVPSIAHIVKDSKKNSFNNIAQLIMKEVKKADINTNLGRGTKIDNCYSYDGTGEISGVGIDGDDKDDVSGKTLISEENFENFDSININTTLSNVCKIDKGYILYVVGKNEYEDIDPIIYTDGIEEVVLKDNNDKELNTNITTITSNQFKDKDLTGHLDLSKYKKLETIESVAFSDKHLTSVVIPESVTTIESSAFNNNNLTSVVIPETVISIGSGAFSNNKLTSIVIPETVTTIGIWSFINNQANTIYVLGRDNKPDNFVQDWDAVDWDKYYNVIYCESIGTEESGAGKSNDGTYYYPECQ